MKKLFTIYITASDTFSARFETSGKGLVLLDIDRSIVEHEVDDCVLLVLPAGDILSAEVPGNIRSVGRECLLQLAEMEIFNAFPSQNISDFIVQTHSGGYCKKTTFMEFVPKSLVAKAKSALPENLNIPEASIISSSSALLHSVIYNYPAESEHNIAILDFAGDNNLLLLFVKNGNPALELSFTYSDLNELQSAVTNEIDRLLAIPENCLDTAYLTGQNIGNESFAAIENVFNQILVSVKFLNPFRLVSGKKLAAGKADFCIEYSNVLAPICGAAVSSFYQSTIL